MPPIVILAPIFSAFVAFYSTVNTVPLALHYSRHRARFSNDGGGNIDGHTPSKSFVYLF